MALDERFHDCIVPNQVVRKQSHTRKPQQNIVPWVLSLFTDLAKQLYLIDNIMKKRNTTLGIWSKLKNGFKF